MSNVKGRRSPNYPSLTLQEAINTARRIYAAQHTYLTDKEVVAQNLGYKGLNGASLTVIGALRRYGLLDIEDEQLKISDDAVAILELPEEHPDRMAAMHRAAYATPLFAEMREAYGDKLPKDVVLKHDLIKRKFLPKAADEVIRIYRDNLELVTPQTPEYTADDTIEDKSPIGVSPMPQPQPQYIQPPSVTATPSALGGQQGRGVFEFRFPLSFQRDVSAVITIYGEKIKRRDLEFLHRKVKDLLEGFEEDEPEQPKAQPEQPKPQPAEPAPQNDAQSLGDLFKDE